MIPKEVSQYVNGFFDKTVVLSLPRLTERQQLVTEKLKGLTFDFFWGVDKNNLDIKHLIERGDYSEVAAKKLQRQGKALIPGEIACAFSHRHIYEMIVENKWGKTLIFEDDVLPLETLHLLPEALSELPANWDVVYLGYSKNEKITFGLKLKQLFYKAASLLGLMKWNYTMMSRLLPKPYSKHLKSAGFHDCTHAYAITLEAAKKLIQLQTPVIYRADDLISYTNLKGELNTFITEPKFFDQENFSNRAETSSVKGVND